MKRLMLIALFFVALSGTLLAQDEAVLPLLVECTGEVGMPCIERVDETSDLIGIWRRSFMGGSLVGTMDVADDGTFTLFEDPQMEVVHVTGSINFEDGLALVGADALPNVPAPCVAPGTYEVQLIRVGEQPVALIYRLIEDACEGRKLDMANPMLFVPEDSSRVWSSATAWLAEAGAMPCKRSAHAVACLPFVGGRK